MANSYFQFKQFTVHQDKCAMKVTTDGCLFGGFVANAINNSELKITDCLDIGTGTGLLALMLSQKNHCSIDAIEIDTNATAQAKENVAASPFTEKINIIHADAREYNFEKKYDVIISNPPFYENELKGNDLSKNIAHHNEGLLLEKLVNIIKQNLKPEGRFYLLLPYKRHEEIKKLMTEHELLIEKLSFVRQTESHNFFRIILTGSFGNKDFKEVVSEEFSIKDDKDQYTVTFLSILKDYYYHL
jgi:tRNA1Val (adenine37-N6)-methyltransferase